MENGLIKKSGSWYTYKGDQLGQGKEKAREFLKENPELSSEIEDGIMRTLKVGPYARSEDAAPDSAMDVPGIDPADAPIDVVPTFDDDEDDD